MLAANAHTPSAGPTAASPAFGMASPGASASPMPLHSVSTPGPVSQRHEILCVFAIESSARMSPNFESLFISYIEPIVRHFRAPPIDPETNQPRPKDAPLVRCGLAIYGDYQPSSASTVDTRYFTNDPVSFLRELRQIKFEYGGVFRNAVTEGLVSALEMFDQYDELRTSDGADPERHLILVADSAPHMTGCRCNSSERYDDFNIENASQELLKVNQPTVDIIDANPKPSVNHVVKLAGFQLPLVPPSIAAPQTQPQPSASTPPVSSSDIQSNNIATATKRPGVNGGNSLESMDLKRETSASSPAATGSSPKLTGGPSAKRTKIEESHAPSALVNAPEDLRKSQQDQAGGPASVSAPDVTSDPSAALTAATVSTSPVSTKAARGTAAAAAAAAAQAKNAPQLVPTPQQQTPQQQAAQTATAQLHTLQQQFTNQQLQALR
ncbi:Mediator of RNA polymerase II transcription subunit 25, partial [Dissophora globulifera]